MLQAILRKNFASSMKQPKVKVRPTTNCRGRPASFLLIATSFLILLASISPVQAEVVQLDTNNIDSVLGSSDLTIVNFYADWCRFSQQLKPIFSDASNFFKDNAQGKVIFAAVDCDRQPSIAQKYHVNKYPTIKFFRYGEPIKKEYRGQRNAESIADFVKNQLVSTVQVFTSKEDLNQRIENSKRNIIGYFARTDRQDYYNFQKAASSLREDCKFWLAAGDWVLPLVPQGNALYYRAPNSQEDFQYTGPFDNYDYLKNWLTDKCVPLVREITFENAEELTEEGIPFLILFRSVGDTESERKFTEVVQSELADQKTAINCLVADGKKFAHPLHHLGKSEKDLPLIAIDSFRHMYLFSDFSKLSEKDRLRQFVLDLHSGKLHREFHHGPDPAAPTPSETQPPPSVFKQLKPSETRYSLLDKTEL